MKPISFLLLVYPFIFGVQSAHAFFGKKLDLNGLQGTYETSLDGKSGLMCPMNIKVIYDAQAATLDATDMSSESSPLAFHFSNINKGSKSTAQEAIPERSEFQDDWIRTSTNSNSIKEEQVSHMISGNTQAPFVNDPLDSSAIVINGQAITPQMVSDYYDTITTKVQYDEKTKILVKSVSYGAQMVDDSETCTYQRTN
jgi:hypothetical protein